MIVLDLFLYFIFYNNVDKRCAWPIFTSTEDMGIKGQN